MYNVRNSQESQSDESDDEDVKKEQSKSKTLPEVLCAIMCSSAFCLLYFR